MSVENQHVYTSSMSRKKGVEDTGDLYQSGYCKAVLWLTDMFVHVGGMMK